MGEGCVTPGRRRAEREQGSPPGAPVVFLLPVRQEGAPALRPSYPPKKRCRGWPEAFMRDSTGRAPGERKPVQDGMLRWWASSILSMARARSSRSSASRAILLSSSVLFTGRSYPARYWASLVMTGRVRMDKRGGQCDKLGRAVGSRPNFWAKMPVEPATGAPERMTAVQ